MLPVWVKSFSIYSSITGIAINPATKWIIAHTGGMPSPYIILIVDPFGHLKGAYSYVSAREYVYM
jgi:hypothetical protein